MKLSASHKRSALRPGLIGLIELRLPSDRLFLRLLLIVIAGSTLLLLSLWSQSFVAETPVRGGTLVEGMIGTPRFVNPILAVTRVDQDMSALLFSGMMKIGPDGTLVPDLAESVTVAEDGQTYNVILRTDVRWHDGTPLTARDIAYTIALIQNAELKSPLRGNWTDVTVEEIGEYELNIIITEPYTPFIENFTVGILPRHIWNELPIEQMPFSQLNTEPIGSGPFALERVTRNKSGLIETYELTKAPGSIYDTKINDVRVRFYQNENNLMAALAAKEIMSTAYASNEAVRALTADNGYTIIEEPLPRIFTIFFNQNRSIALRDSAARKALGVAINRDELVAAALGGYGVPTNQPVPPVASALQSADQSNELISSSTADAVTILTEGGWTKNSNGNWEKELSGNTEILTVTIQTANVPLFIESANYIARTWRDLGIPTQIDQYEQSDLLQGVIRTRDFQALMFGIDMSRSVDLYPFWHSSQREDPGLNIAQYANIEVDALLDQARTTQDSAERAEAMREIIEIIDTETPALFLFVPSMTYVVRPEITVAPLTGISRPQERFMNISDWYLATDNLWPMFRQE